MTTHQRKGNDAEENQYNRQSKSGGQFSLKSWNGEWGTQLKRGGGNSLNNYKPNTNWRQQRSNLDGLADFVVKEMNPSARNVSFF